MPRSKDRETVLSDVIITAVEGGTGYWATAADYHWSDEQPSTTRVKLTPEDDRSVELPVTVETVAQGVALIVDVRGEFKIRDDLRETIRLADRENDAGHIDAEGADAIVQAAIFGELVYG